MPPKIKPSIFFNVQKALLPVTFIEACKELDHKIACVAVQTYTLPPSRSLNKTLTDEVVESLDATNFSKFQAFFEHGSGRFTKPDSETRLDHQPDNYSIFYNTQLQLNTTKLKKSTIAKVLVDKQLLETTCPTCQKNLVPIFKDTLLKSFLTHLPSSVRDVKDGVVFAIVQNASIDALDANALKKLQTIKL